jgi:excisionase family DNA binding protein
MTKSTMASAGGDGPQELVRLLTPSELSEMLGVPVATLYSWRYHGRGPAAVRVGRHLRYRLSDVDAWLAYSELEQGRRI